MSGSLRLDLHVHSVHSPDSRLTLETVVELLGPRGLQGFALTDHNTVAGHARLRELQTKFPRYLFIPGVEVSTADGHLLAYGVTSPPPRDRPVQETIRWVTDQGGVAILAHPYRTVHGVGDKIARTIEVTGLETMNSHNRPVANARAEVTASRRGLATTGGSDAHDPEDVGCAYTELPEEVASVEEVLHLMRRGRVQASGRSQTPLERVRILARTGFLRARRGFRPI